MSLWTLSEAANAMGVATHLSGEITGISIDSRTIKPHEAYFAIQGERLDGHDFAEECLNKGASVAVVSKAWAATKPHNPRFFIVEDVLEALRQLGRAARARMHGKVIAITGSVGKTSSKETLAKILNTFGITHAAMASFNNHWGVPLTLARMPRETAFGIFEIGMNHSGEITPLVEMVRPHIALITTIAPVHLAHFKNVEEIALAKAEIFDGLEPGGIAVLNRDNPFFPLLSEKAKAFKVLSFGESVGADMRAKNITLHSDNSLISASFNGKTYEYMLSIAGKHLAMNSLGILAIIEGLQLEIAKALPLFATQSAVKGRGLVQSLSVHGKNYTLFDESYNANPLSMRAAFAVLKSQNGRKIAAIGDMLELGNEAITIHQALASEHAGIDLFFCAGPLMKHCYEALPKVKQGGYSETALGLLPLLEVTLNANDNLMIKGSLGSRMIDLAAKLVELGR
jgi:UDP-N-acetylmuramoyl-tripeptide--D-alanyl-D-alanine ligase